MKVNFQALNTRALSVEEKIQQALLAGKTLIRVNWGYPRNPTKTGLTPLTSNQGRWSYNSEKAQAFLKFNPWSVQTLSTEGTWASNTKFQEIKGGYEAAGQVTGFVKVLASSYLEALGVDPATLKPTQSKLILDVVWAEASLDFGPSLDFEELEAKKVEAFDNHGPGLYRSAVVGFDLKWKLIEDVYTLQLRNGEVLDWDQPVFSLVQAGAISVSMLDALKTSELFTLEGRKESKPSLGKLAKATAGKNRRRKDKRREAIEAWKAKQNPNLTPPPLPQEEPAADEAVGEGLADSHDRVY
jgi:hypothetical protein